MNIETMRRILEEVVFVADRSKCSKCGRAECGNPARLRRVSQIPDYLRWHHTNRDLCEASANIEAQYQKVFGGSERPTRE